MGSAPDSLPYRGDAFTMLRFGEYSFLMCYAMCLRLARFFHQVSGWLPAAAAAATSTGGDEAMARRPREERCPRPLRYALASRPIFIFPLPFL